MFVYHNGGGKCRRVSDAFARGSRWRVVDVKDGIRKGPVAMYGVLRGLYDVLTVARAEGRRWYYMDNAYFGHGEYYRCTRQALQYSGSGARPRGLSRLDKHRIEWQEWSQSGDHILIAQQSPVWYEVHGIGSRESWTESVVRELRKHTDRQIRIRPKGAKMGLASDLKRCWAVVTWSSNVAIDAIVAGVPVFTLGPSAAGSLASSDLSRIENPIRSEDRLHWAANLAANQWTLDEMRSGQCWAEIHEAA